MSGHSTLSPDDARETVSELRMRLGLFSFRQDESAPESTVPNVLWPSLGLRSGGIVEWLLATPGAGAVTSALQMISRSSFGSGVWAMVDVAGECYPAALPGWGLDLGRTLLVRPSGRWEAYWAIEQCLRCPGVSATWAWIERGVPERVHRRWYVAAEAGGGLGLFFRPDSARREPAWADLRLRATPEVGDQGDTRRMRIDVLYRRGGLGGTAQVWEIDHAEGAVRLVPEVANPATATRKARA